MVESTLALELEKQSSSLLDYLNNLDTILGIKTLNDNKSKGLILVDNTLHVQDDFGSWYIVDKHPTEALFKIVGVSDHGPNQNLVYILGRRQNHTFLLKIDNKYLRIGNVKTCLKSVEVSIDLGFLKPTLVVVGILAALGAIGWFVVYPLIKSSTSAVNTAVTAVSPDTVSSTTNAIAGLLPIVFVVMIILAVVVKSMESN